MALTDVVEALMQRLAWHETSPDAASVLDAEVLAWGAEILLGFGPPEGQLGRRASVDDVLTLKVAGSLYLYRGQSRPDGEQDQDLEAACAVFALLLPHHGDVLDDDLREAVAGTEWLGPSDGLNAWNEVGLVHLQAAEGRADATALNQAIALFQQAERVGPPDHPARVLLDMNLSHALRLRSERSRDMTDARAAVARAKSALARRPAGEVEATSWLNLVAAQSALANLGEPGALDTAVNSARRAAATVAEDAPSRPRILANLGTVLRQRHLAGGSADDLRDAYRATREAWMLLATQPPSPLRVRIDLNLAMVLLDLYHREPRPEYLSDAIGRLVRGTAELPDDHPDRFGVVEGLVRARLCRLDASGEDADRDAAMAELAGAMLLPTSDATKIAAMRGILGQLHHDRWVGLGDSADLNSALDLLTRSQADLPVDHPYRPMTQTVLAACLRDRFEQTRQPEDLLWALELLQGVTAREDFPPIAERLRALVRSERANLDGDVGTLRQCARVLRDALDGHDGDDDRRRKLTGLALTLTYLARHSGAPGDLEAAIDTARQAVAGASHGVARSVALANLSASLLLRYQTHHGLSDLNETIDALDMAIADLPTRHQLRRNLLSSLGLALMLRYGRVGDEQDLVRSVACHRQSLLHTPPDEISSERLSRLAGALIQYFVDAGDRPALLEAIDRSRKAAARAVKGSYDHCVALGWLARALSQRAMAEHDPDVGDEAVGAMRQAIAVAKGPLSSGMRLLLARILWQRQLVEAEPDRQIEAAIDAYRAVVDDVTVLAWERFEAAGEWSIIADEANQPALALEGSCHAARLLPEAAWLGVHRRDQLQLIAAHNGLAQFAARCAVANGQPALAIELAECARTVLAGQALQMRRDLNSLRRKAPELAARMIELAAVLDDTGLSTLDDSRAMRSLDLRIRAARDWQQLYAEAARVLGPDATFPPDQPTYARMAASLTAPVAYINVTSTTCVALLMHPGSAAPDVVELPDLRQEDIDAAISALRQAAPGRADRVARASRARQTLTGTLAWLWETVAEPILTAAGAAAPVPSGATWPRLVWCPSGALARLPIHAAQTRQGDGALDRVISSYTTSVRALLRPDAVRSTPTLLVVSAANAPGLPPLPAAVDEARALSRIVEHTSVLEGRHAAADDVLAAIPAHTCVHFACHAGWTDASPSGTPRLALTTGDITPLDLAGLRLDGADLAYLSACDTTVGLPDAADEGLHIAGAIQLAGFRHVISTLWTIEDRAAAELAEDVYARMTGPGKNLEPARAPEALHHAVRDLRHRSPGTPGTWAAYLHLGGFSR
ncbi:CHAT domain-containing protein [Dactylosporangium sp. CA-139066]|uniref:CHAT domain-containing protein n=1 Tax=Dactylosporangium sp. CA-139066 TaxID=3239930 RepID=UPI003D91C30A